MVVTRRTPVVPQPQLARNPSLRGAQRPPSAKDTATVPKNTPAATSVDSSSAGDRDNHNGLDNKKTKKSRRRGKNKYRISTLFSVCSQDTHSQSPICRGLTEYKRIVLDPYIIPPIQAAFAHPSVAPHIERAKPYVHRAVEITTPILFRAQQEWNLHVVPEWNKRIVPQWNKYVVPQWDQYVAPRIQLAKSQVKPYHTRIVQAYSQRVAPRARVAFYNLQRWRRQAEPYVLMAVSKTKDGYYAAKPYAVPLAKKLGYLLQQFALSLREQRQKFVDPHVAKIWEKVKELSSGQVIHQATPEHEPSEVETTLTVSEIMGYETGVSSFPFSSAYDVMPTSSGCDVADVPSSLSADDIIMVKPDSMSGEPTLASEPEPMTPPPLADAPTSTVFVLDVESTVVDSQHETGASVPDATSFVDEPKYTVLAPATPLSSLRPPSAADQPRGSPTPVRQAKVTVPAVSARAPLANSRPDDEINMDAFYAELGLDEPLGSPDVPQEYNSVPPTERDDEKAERLRLKAEETSRKRADIEARQAKWEADLDAQMAHSTSQLQNRLSNLRTVAATELASSAEVRNSIEELVNEAEKYIKGAEIYLRNLKGENRRPDEKLALWDRVADRVNAKFIERLSATEAVVNAWYGTVLDKELEEVATVTAEVRQVAEKGQLDLGLDYAWLEDVTYNDWQRYHALIGTSERYAHEAASIQNGTHPGIVVTNPLQSIVADLESEIQDVVIGFETRLRRIKRDGERAFNNHFNGVAQKEEEKGSNTVEPDLEVTVPSHHGEGFVPPVVIGRNQEQVLEVLGKIEPVVESEELESGTNNNPGEAVPRSSHSAEHGA